MGHRKIKPTSLFLTDRKIPRIPWFISLYIIIYLGIWLLTWTTPLPKALLSVMGTILVPLVIIYPSWIIIVLFVLHSAFMTYGVFTMPPPNTDKVNALISILTSFCSYLLILIGLRYYVKQTDKAREDAQKADRAKTMFLANMSHEIRTPLTGIIGFTHILKDRLTDPYEQKLIRIVHSSGQQLLHIVNDILDFSSIQEGQVKLHISRFNLPFFIKSLTEKHKLEASKRGLTFHYEIDMSVPREIFSDPIRLNQILDNLISNAIKFTEEGSVILTVKMTDWLVFSIKDTGPGISGDNLGKVFDQFYQTDSSFKKPNQGKGLGLSISRQLARMMGGDITVESKQGEGSRFILTLPCRT